MAAAIVKTIIIAIVKGVCNIIAAMSAGMLVAGNALISRVIKICLMIVICG